METNKHLPHLNSDRFLQTVSDAILALDPDLNIMGWNRAAERMYGWNAAEVMNKSFVEVTEVKYLHDSQEDAIHRLFETGFWSGEVIQKQKTGENAHVRTSLTLITNESGTPVGIVAVNHDLKHHKNIEAELVSLVQFPSENPNPVLRIAHNGSIVFANAAAQEILHKSQGDARRSLLELWNQYAKKALQSGLRETAEITLDDLIFAFEITPVPEASYVNIYGRDVTERIKAETELKKSHWTLTERVKELTCLYHAIQAMETTTSLDDLGPRIIELLVPAMQFPEITAPVLEIQDARFTHPSFKTGLTHNIHSDIVLDSKKVGQLSVYYTLNLPFLIPEEQNMLNALSESLSGWLHRKHMDAKIIEYSHNLENLVNERTQKLEESDDHARTQYQGIPIPILTWQKTDDDFILIDYNKANDVLTKGQIKHYLGATASTFFEKNPDMLEDLWHCYNEHITIKRERLYTLLTTGEPRFFALTYGFISPDLVLIHVEDISERKRLEDELRASEEQYRNLFLVARDGILLADSSGNIISANPAAARILGYESIQTMIGSSIPDLYYDPDRRRIIMTQLLQNGYLDNFEVKIKRKDGSIADVLASSILRKNRDGSIVQIETVFTDISSRKQEERDMRRRLMKFQLEDGRLYFVQDDVPILAQEAYRDLLNAGYEGIAVSRSTESDFRQLINGAYTYHRLTEQGTEITSLNMTTLHQLFVEHPRNTVFLIDCLDYLSIKNGFDEVLRFVYWLKDIVIMNGNIGILVGDPAIFSKNELHAFEKEMLPITVRNPQIPADLLEIVHFIHRQNGFGIQPKYADIQRFLGISKPTTSKRIQQLIENGYVREFARGSRKCLQLSYSGVRLVSS
ncbi:MAG: PAS domain S-box protein [Candidatus Bathyarchaeota archaeon]|jgi:PAS domain S-box-containing protein|nr:PAS domain S-box protein [Candidatus Bathyarchaeota archaeon]